MYSKIIKIGFINADIYNYFFQDESKTFGGASRIYTLVKHLSKHPGFDVTCFVGDHGQPDKLQLGNITLIKGTMDKWYHALNTCLILLNPKNRQDIIVEFYASARTFILGLLKKIWGRHFVFFVGCDIDVNGAYAKLTNPLFYRLYVWGLSQANRIVCQTPEQQKMLKDTYGLNSTLILSPYKEIKSPLNFQKKNILWVGRSAFFKRPKYFLDLAEALPDERFVMICVSSENTPGDKNGKQIMSIQIRAQKLANVDFYEYIPNNRIISFFSQAKLFVNTSDMEGFPNTFIEAALEKTPVLSLNVDPNGMLNHHKAGVCCGGDREKFNKMCLLLSSDDALLSKLGENARRYAVNHHNIENAIKKIIEVFEGVVRGSHFN